MKLLHYEPLCISKHVFAKAHAISIELGLVTDIITDWFDFNGTTNHDSLGVPVVSYGTNKDERLRLMFVAAFDESVLER